MKIRMSILDMSDGTTNYYGLIEDSTKKEIETIAIIVSENYHFQNNTCFIPIDADNITDATNKYNTLKSDFDLAVKHTQQIIQLIDNGYTFGQIKAKNMLSPKKKTDAQLKANKKYLDALDEIKIRMQKGYKDKIKTKAESMGMSVNAYIMSLIENDL